MLEWPKWRQDLEVYQNLKSAFIMQGNVHDLQVWVDEQAQCCSPKTLNNYMYDFLKAKGYDIVVFYNKIDGFFNLRCQADVEAFRDLPMVLQKQPGRKTCGNRSSASLPPKIPKP